MVASAPKLAQHRTILRYSGEHGQGHCVADQGQARQQTTPHCREKISRIHNKRGEWIQRREIPWEELLQNGLIQITLEGFSKQTAQDGTRSAGLEAGTLYIFQIKTRI
jgi:hypothetical protein